MNNEIKINLFLNFLYRVNIDESPLFQIYNLHHIIKKLEVKIQLLLLKG